MIRLSDCNFVNLAVDRLVNTSSFYMWRDFILFFLLFLKFKNQEYNLVKNT